MMRVCYQQGYPVCFPFPTNCIELYIWINQDYIEERDSQQYKNPILRGTQICNTYEVIIIIVIFCFVKELLSISTEDFQSFAEYDVKGKCIRPKKFRVHSNLTVSFTLSCYLKLILRSRLEYILHIPLHQRMLTVLNQPVYHSERWNTEI